MLEHLAACTADGSPFRDGPITALAGLEKITAAWVHWYNTARLMHRLGLRPPAEADAGYWGPPPALTARSAAGFRPA